MPSTSADRAEQVGEHGRRLVRSRPYELTFWPSSVISTTPSSASRSHLVDELVERATDLAAAHRGHDAERAGVVAADLDRDPRRVIDLAFDGDRGREGVGVVGRLVPDLRDRAVLAGLMQQIDGPVHVVGAEHDVDVARLLADEIAILLGEAAADHDLQVRARVLERLEVTERAVELVVGVLADAAGVEHHDIGVVDRVGRRHAVGLEQPGDALGVVLVHLTPEGADQVPLGHNGPG